MPPVQQPYAEINVTGWSVVGDEALGTKPKRWLKHPETGERWLMERVLRRNCHRLLAGPR